MNFVLVHGAWHDGSCWDGVRAALESAGHAVRTPTLAGHGPDADLRATHADCAQGVVDCIVGQSLEDVVLVGHSFGGTVIQKVAEAIPERLARLVFLNAFVLRDGESLVDALPEDYARVFEVAARRSGDGTMVVPFEVFRDMFIGDADLATARRVHAGLRPIALALFAEQLDLKKFARLETPRSYLNCTEDIAFPQHAGGWHPGMSGRLGVFRLVQMPGSHESMYTRPAALADKLIEAGRD